MYRHGAQDETCLRPNARDYTKINSPINSRGARGQSRWSGEKQEERGGGREGGREGDKATLTFIVITSEVVSHDKRAWSLFYGEKRARFKGGIEKMERYARKQKNRERME